MEENFSMEWNMEWKIFGMEWKWNGRKLPVWNMEKSSFIPFHTMPCMSFDCMHFARLSFFCVYTEKRYQHRWAS